jgi:asparagine synthase (glutamine-hydrolysing)
MSVQFGRWNFDGRTPAPEYVERVNATLAPYGPDSNEAYSTGGVNILYRAFHTTKESCRETQPHVSPSGAVTTWDGRLDNRAELISELRDSLTIDSTDVAIVAATYEKWGTGCFSKLIGDWALSIWNPINRSLILAKDPIGTRHLYYSFDNNEVTWSTILDPLVQFAGKAFALNEEYIAGWLAIMFPAAHLTPYVGIHAVPPSSSTVLRLGRDGVKETVSKYWDFDPEKKIRYRTDAEYEEHFRTVFAKAVQHRLRSDRPVLADLSGGMDSSSIVCMADIVIARGAAETNRIDTISWYDDSNPGMDECLYFIKVEEKRGRTGCHIDLGALRKREGGSQRSLRSEFENDRLAATPIPSYRHSEFVKQYAAYMRSNGHRVALSGIGGSEFLGDGVPTPRQELQNLLARIRLFTLARQLNAWAAKMRKSRIPLLWEAVEGFFLAVPVETPKKILTTPWFNPGFVRRNLTAFCGYPSRVKLFGPLPSFQDNIGTLGHLQRVMAYDVLSPELLREVRYPYLDRSLLEFMFAIPREQIVRVGQRRSLMKRALAGIVPDELLHRRKKAFVPQASPKDSSTEWPNLRERGQQITAGITGIVDPDRFAEALQKARHSEDVSVDLLKSTLALESWLRHLTTRGVLTNSISPKRQDYSLSLVGKELSTPAQPKSSAS